MKSVVKFRKSVMMRAKKIGFLLVDGFATITTAAAMDPLRAANLFSDVPPYDIVPLSTRGGLVRASLPVQFETRTISEEKGEFDLIFVVAGGDPWSVDDPAMIQWLRAKARAGVTLGGISGGSAILAKAGLMENRRFTVHWHYLEQVQALPGAFHVDRKLFVIDRDRYSCAGGTAPLDMMHAMIASDLGVAFARQVADWFIQTDIRPAHSPQQAGFSTRFGPLPQAVEEALNLMESHVGDPLTLDQLADLVNMSKRQLQRLFQGAVGESVMTVYRHMRLQIAQDLIKRTRLPLSEISDMTGFASQSVFSQSYTKWQGHAPRIDRETKRI